MSVVSLKKPTVAEEALFEAYEGFDTKTDASEAAIATLKDRGLPTRRVEAWHYTDLRASLKSVPSLTTRPSDDEAVKLAASYDAAIETARIPVLNGHVFVDLAKAAPDGVRFLKSNTTLKSDIPDENTIGLLSQAFAGDCLHVDIADGTEVTTPIGIGHLVSDNALLTINQHAITVGAKSKATVIERYTGAENTAYQNNAVTNLSVGDEADATYLIVLQNGGESAHLGQLNITLGADAKLTLFVLNAGGRLSRQDLNIHVAGEGADFQLRGVNLIGDDQHIDVTMDLGHAVPNTTSEEIIRNVIVGKGKGVFQGKIRVAQIAQKTDAKMTCNTLLLSDDGDFSTKPELEIFADDVACGHGATFADIEPSYMFYLMSRGIPEKEARALLIKGFVDEIVEDLDNETLEEAMVGIIDGWLDAHG